LVLQMIVLVLRASSANLEVVIVKRMYVLNHWQMERNVKIVVTVKAKYVKLILYLLTNQLRKFHLVISRSVGLKVH